MGASAIEVTASCLPFAWLLALCACGSSSGAHSDAPAVASDAPDADADAEPARDAARDAHAGGDAAGACTPTGTHAAIGAVEAGGSSSCALYADGRVACWGRATYGQLGDGVATHTACGPDDCSFTPVIVSGIADATAIAVGSDIACALHAGGTVSCWGDGSAGALGDGVTTHATTCHGFDCSRVPVTVSGLTDAIAISASVTEACAVRQGGQVVCWGANDHDQLGDGGATHGSCKVGINDPYDCSRVPITVSGIADAVGVGVGSDFVCARRTGGAVACWGDGKLGTLGNGATTTATTPVAVTGVADAIALRSGFGNACALHATGTVSCWGWNDGGMLGDGDVTHQACTGANDCSPTPVTVTGLSNATAIAGDWSHACAERATGDVACWGDDQYQELGNGGAAPEQCEGPCSRSPVAVVGVTSPVALTAGSFSSCALAADCSVACWGFNLFGQLGDGTTTNRPTPVGVVGL